MLGLRSFLRVTIFASDESCLRHQSHHTVDKRKGHSPRCCLVLGRAFLRSLEDVRYI